MNDPVGGLVHGGRQHLFFQYVPASTTWRQDCHWGHLVGDDLVRWTHLPVALAPGDGDDGVWSGSAVVDDTGPVLLYTSVTGGDLDRGRIALARPTDPDLVGWRKTGPVLDPPPGVTVFRDPFVTGRPGDWTMLVGAGRAGLGAVLRYTSPDLATWRYEGVLAEGEGQVWECPQYADLGGTRALIVSLWDGGALTRVAASCGTERDGTFTGGPWETVGHGGSAYALTTFRDRDGELTAIAWLRHDEPATGDWAGMLSLPVRLVPRPGGGLGVTWHPDVDTLRREELSGDFPDGVADLEADLEPGARLRLGPVTITATADGLDVDGTAVPGEPRLRVVVDRGVIEAWTADGRWIALRVPHLHVRRAALEGGGRLAAWRAAR